MSAYHPQALVDEWNAVLDRAAPAARVILRSAHASPDYLRTVRVGAGSDARWLPEAVRFDAALAATLSRSDRVHTYAGFHIGDVQS
jgi:S-adenosylmethionine-diacylglycerol 3-amino-3-carboxypropyl transferase